MTNLTTVNAATSKTEIKQTSNVNRVVSFEVAGVQRVAAAVVAPCRSRG